MLRSIIRLWHLRSLNYHPKNPCLTSRPFSALTRLSSDSVEKIPKPRELLSVLFKRAVGPESVGQGEGETETETQHDSVNADLIEGLIKLEEQVRNLKRERSKNVGTFNLQTERSDPITRRKADRPERNTTDRPARSKETGNGIKAKRSLSALFSDIDEGGKSIKPVKFGFEDPKVLRELSPDMKMFTKHLYLKGYLKDANFIPKNEYNSTLFETSSSREFLKHAAVKFGKDHQEIAKWLSSSDIKKIALYGCPSLGRRTIQAAKNLRSFFEIEEHKVCQKCPLKESCKLADKSSSRGKKLYLDTVTRLLSMYALGSVAEQLIVPEEVMASVNQLLKEIVNLSRNLS